MQETLLKPYLVKRVKRARGVSVHTSIVDIACGSYATYAVDEEGHVWGWGLNNYGQLGMPGQVSFYCAYQQFALPSPSKLACTEPFCRLACLSIGACILL